MKHLLALFVLMAASNAAWALTVEDQGVFALVDNQGAITTKVARVTFLDGQWHLEDRLPDGSWQDVSCGAGCTLRIATASEIADLVKDTVLSGKPLRCVMNEAFAFCSEAGASYHMLAFSGGQVIPLTWIRLDPDTLEPVPTDNARGGSRPALRVR